MPIQLNNIRRYSTSGITTSTGSSSGSVVETTFDELAVLVDSETLVPGTFYSFPYQTVYEQIETFSINYGATETLVVQAATTSTFYFLAKSLDYPSDYIEYDFNDRFVEDGATPRPGFIHFRKDTDRNNSAPFDFRNIKFRRWAIYTDDVNLPYKQSYNYVPGDLVYENGIMYRCRLSYISSPTGLLSQDVNDGYWQFMFNLTATKYVAPDAFWIYNFAVIPISITDFIEVLAFDTFFCRNVEIGYNPGNSKRFNHNVVLKTNSFLTNFYDIFISGISSRVTLYGSVNFNSISLQGKAEEVLICNTNASTGNDVTLDVGQTMFHCSMSNSTFKLRGNASYVSLNNSYVTAENGFDSGSGDTFRNSSAVNSEINVSGVVNSNFFNCKTIVCRKINASNGVSRFRNIDGSGGRSSMLEGLSDCNILGSASGIHIRNTNKKTFTGVLNSFVFISNNNTLTVTYSGSYSNVVATLLSPSGGVFYGVTDDLGNVTYSKIL